MVNITPISLDDAICLAVTVELPKTRLVAIKTDIGYIMCGALDVRLLNTSLADRRIVAARAVGVKTVEQLLEAPLESVTGEAESMGIHPGMTGADALRVMIRHARCQNGSPVEF
ncbi:MAG: YunC family protein [Bacilli bacterium]